MKLGWISHNKKKLLRLSLGLRINSCAEMSIATKHAIFIYPVRAKNVSIVCIAKTI